ncbi:hypothetical protein BCR33DRAFT_764394 [Rhizoclosmatium globosum]|uniref:Uncharacterized protein n=1 Tax=Rhizoclosmatium globosum TaxID=329046 RepID=A0A1Y2CK31_9FUNG|nr:hypothetical protein BCR33DRAFT_764394 [Rhizoclosmatium globosum]|eukprot:ORY47373.1 hypothetical protein BCR33DRAFT_764394 [Rhizoclosmatium globosum]
MVGTATGLPTSEGVRTIYSLAPETVEQILRYLPIDANLREVGFASKSLFAPILFNSFFHARKHVAHTFSIQKWHCIWSFVLGTQIHPQREPYPPPRGSGFSWLMLPFNCRLVLYRGALRHNKCLTHHLDFSRNSAVWQCNDMLKIVNTLLLDKTFDPSCQGNRTLLWACERGDLDVVKVLLTDNRVTFLDEAFLAVCSSAHEDVLRLFLNDTRIDPSVQDNLGLVDAAKFGSVSTVRLLLADPRVDPSRRTDLFAAAVCNSYEPEAIVKLLLEDGRSNPGGENNAAICLATIRRRAECVEMLLRDPRVDPTAQDGRPLQEAVARGISDVARLLLDDPRVDPSAFDNIAVRIALSNLRPANDLIEDDGREVIRMLMNDERVDLAAGDSQILCNAVYMRGNWIALAMLMEDNQVNPACHNNLPLRLAAQNIDLQCVQILLKDDRVNPMDEANNAIFAALENDWVGTAEVLNALLTDRRVVNRTKDYGLACELYEAGELRELNCLLKHYGFPTAGPLRPLNIFEMCTTAGSDESQLKQKVLELWKLLGIDYVTNSRVALQCLLMNWGFLVGN